MMATDAKGSLRVLLAIPFPPPDGGITNWSRIILSALKKDERVECQTIDISLKAEAADRGLIANAMGLWRILSLAKDTFKSSSNSNQSVLHICSSGGKGFLRDLLLTKAAHRHSIPVILHFHFGRIPSLLEGSSLESYLLASVLKESDGLVAMDQATYGALVSYCAEKRSFLIPNPIDISALECPEGIRYNQVVFVGHVNEQKGIFDLLKAWDSTCARNAGARLKIIGPVQPEFEERISRWILRDDVMFTGSLSHDEVLAEIAASKCLVLPSYTEGFPNVILEAFAMKTPVVASDVGALPEMLSDGAGIVVSPGDIDGIRVAIDRVLSEDSFAKQIGARGRDKAVKEYSDDNVEEALYKCWTEVRRNYQIEDV